MKKINNKSKFNQGIITLDDLIHPEKYSGKLKNQIIFRSSWELAFAKYCDRNDNILEWKSEENVVIYKSPIDHRNHRYFIDFYIKVKQPSGKTKEFLIEIKPYKKTLKPVLTERMQQKTKVTLVKEWGVNSAKWAAAKAHAQKYNMIFKIVTENDLFNIKTDEVNT
jgi:hypothetical protein